ncbi:hypothetical protein V8G54_008324, partial [Vigna mungo]
MEGGGQVLPPATVAITMAVNVTASRSRHCDRCLGLNQRSKTKILTSLVELRAAQESIEIVHKSIVSVPSSLVVQQGETTLDEKDELSTCNRRHRRSEASSARSFPLPKQ